MAKIRKIIGREAEDDLKLKLKLGRVSFSLVTSLDAEFVLRLRLDSGLNRFLNSTSADLEIQKDWISKYKLREAEGLEYYFVIHKESEKVGLVRMYDFRGLSFCWGSWVILRGTEPHVALASVAIIYDLAFDHIGFKKSHFDVRKDNLSVKRFHLRMGAVIVESDELNDYYQYHDVCYASYRPKLMQLIDRKN